nr:MAG TPA: hypothetical protein [Caudoviricetes sp.]
MVPPAAPTCAAAIVGSQGIILMPVRTMRAAVVGAT